MLLKDKNILVTGGAGFIGSHLVECLVSMGNKVIVCDNLSTGFYRFVNGFRDTISFLEIDLLSNTKDLLDAMHDVDIVFHFAANADIKNNLREPQKCIDQNILVTLNILEAMKMEGVKNIVFTSSGSVYGEPDVFPTPENVSFPVQTSIYGTSKIACEGLISSYCEGHDFRSVIFRFVSLAGERYSHGCIFDFYKKLKSNPDELLILGDGQQRKSFLYVKDGIDAMITATEKSNSGVNIYNVGHDSHIDITSVAKIICEKIGLIGAKFAYTGGRRGWVGDSPFVYLDNTKLRRLGWKPRLSIKEAIEKTVDWLRENEWILERK